jgi:hypothetical protein
MVSSELDFFWDSASESGSLSASGSGITSSEDGSFFSFLSSFLSVFFDFSFFLARGILSSPLMV